MLKKIQMDGETQSDRLPVFVVWFVIVIDCDK